MGCCSSSNSVAHSKSPTKASIPNVTICQNTNIAIQPNTERVNPHQLQQHHDINQGQYESSEEEDVLPRSFANNRSIVNEVMRLEQLESDPHNNNNNNNNNKNPNNIETKSNEISEDVQVISNNESFGEFTTHTTNINDAHNSNTNVENNTNIELEDAYHPFGLVQTQNEEIVINKQHKNGENGENEENEENETDEVVDNLEELYAENLKQHAYGFDVNKFRTANTSTSKQHVQDDKNQKGQSVDLSFASSQKSQILSKYDINHNDFIVEHDDDEDEEEDDEDLILEELSRPTSMFDNEGSINDNYESSYIQSLKEAVKSNHKINIMDDQDEELMNAILSLDLDD